MNSLSKGIIVGALQCVLVLSLTGKLFYDRSTCPRVWVKTMPWDPNLPIRGRYLALVLTPDSDSPYFQRMNHERVVFFVTEHQTELDSLTFRRNAPDLWVEVTIPRKGPPRPIRMGFNKEGQFIEVDSN